MLTINSRATVLTLSALLSKKIPDHSPYGRCPGWHFGVGMKAVMSGIPFENKAHNKTVLSSRATTLRSEELTRDLLATKDPGQ